MRLMPKAPIRITEVTPAPSRKGWTSIRQKLYERGGIAQGVGYKALPPELGLRVVDEIRTTGDGWQELIIYKYKDFDIDEI